MRCLWSEGCAMVSRLADGVACLCRRNAVSREILNGGRLCLGLRDFGPWWVELYRLPGPEGLYLAQFLGLSGRDAAISSLRLESESLGVVEMVPTGSRYFARLADDGRRTGELRLVAEGPDGSVLSALWSADPLDFKATA